MKNFSVSGDFGQVRLGPVFWKSDGFASLDHIDQCGWHCVNDLYCIDRPGGAWDYLLIFTVAGRGEVRLPDGMFAAGQDTLVLIPPDTPCRYYSPPKGRWEFYWMHVSGNGAAVMIETIVKAKGMRFDFPFGAVRGYFQRILNAGYTGMESELFAAKMISKILFAVLYAIPDENRFRSGNDTVNSVMEYIEEHGAEPFSISRLSKIYFISEEHLIRLFKRRTGMTPYRYYRHLKIVKSAYALEYSDASLSEIAGSAGYSSVTSFSIQFKKEMLFSPTEYRKNHWHYQN